MSSGNPQRILAYIVFLLILQIPLLHNWVLFGVAFPFPYVGFLLLMPLKMGRGWLMTVGFFIGLTIDVFSDTPGMHASASVLICYTRGWWYGAMLDMGDEDLDLTLTHLGWGKFALMCFPILFVHHSILFVFENEGINQLWQLLGRILWSSVLSFVIILLVAFATAPKRKR